MPLVSRLSILLPVFLSCIGCSVSALSAAQRALIVPTRTIYPNELLRPELLTSRVFLFNPVGQSPYVESIGQAAGLVARSTLPAYKPILLTAIGETQIISAGSSVMIFFDQGGLSISTNGTALQSGSLGDVIRVRNNDSGVVIFGTVERNAIVRMRNE